ncbi:WD40 repeat [Actinacidiphila paucisporea]|uniref:WD40 repeat n=1 Tax=Actinacidiphila paucisporea TaxID=310782 RepID=A0A1M7QE09_9ACTN|nr:WD40 repeat [Actinacidiphila paucisporea]
MRSDLLFPDDPSVAGDAKTAWAGLAEARLIVVEGEYSEIAHESLFTYWPELRGWITEARDRLLERQEIDEAARHWRGSGRLPGEYRRSGRAADRRKPWPADSDVRLDRDQRQFLDVSVRTARRRRLVSVGAISVIITLLAASTVSLLVARHQSEKKAKAQSAANAQQLVTVADSMRGDDPRTALLLAVAGSRAGASEQADTVLQRIFQATAFDGEFTAPPTAGSLAPAVNSISYGDDGHQLAVGTDAGSTVLLDPTRRPMRELASVPYGHGGKVTAVSYAPTAGLLAEGGSDGNVRLVSTTDPGHRRVATLDAGGSPVSSVAWSSDSRLVAVGTHTRGTLLWDVSDAPHPTPLPPLPSPVAVDAVAFAPAGRLVATAGDDAQVTLWDLSHQDRPVVHRLAAGVTSPLDALAFSPDGTMLASGSKDGSAQLWTAAGSGRWRRPASLGGHTAAVLALAFSPDSRTLATASADASTVLWQVEDRGGASQSGTLLGHHAAVTSVAFSPDGHTLATGSSDGSAVRWDLYHHQNAAAQPVSVGSPRRAEALTTSTSGAEAAVAHDDGTVDLIDLAHPAGAAASRRLDVTAGDPLTAAAFAAQDTVLVTGAASGAITVTGLGPRPLPVSHWQAGTADVRALAAAPRAVLGTRLLAVADGGTLTVWDLADPAHPRPLHTLPEGRSSVSCLSFSGDGRRLAVGHDDGGTTLWNLASPQHPAVEGSFTTPRGSAVLGTAFSPDGTRLAVAASDENTYLLATAAAGTPRRLATLPDATTAVGFVPGTDMLICLTKDGTPVVWDLSDPTAATRLFIVRGGTGDTTSLSVTADGGMLLSVGAQGGIRAWHLSDLIPLTQLMRHACVLAGGPLTPAQWSRYAPSLRYQADCG